jgi:hypothetical protein
MILTPRVRPLKPTVGVVKSLALIGAGPVGLIHAHGVGIKYKKPTLGRRPIHVCFREKSGHRILSASSPFMTDPMRTCPARRYHSTFSPYVTPRGGQTL